ncbi:NlpC/P60 family protein [Streptomyces sp. A3M-1-3]|uniref:C40 family peptidase n=1 Tax=Streptomyces sp. A3M-1-3 TaxID=2962044 RepID=UPI0020B6B2BC|nr:C40 family peptidase [Streptomyces sp. A3M-1-3]MCP3821727.1 NlpC/P60 family protein [Streptomyces sp. A3M-1-3]
MSGRFLRSVCTAGTAALAAAVVAGGPAASAVAHAVGPPPAPTAGSAVPERPVAELLTELQKLYRKAEEATEAYNGTDETLKQRQAETRKLSAALSRARLALNGSRGDAGRLAREQYQGRTGFSPYLRLLLAQDPQHALDERHLIRRESADRAATLARLTGNEKRADELATRARKALDAQQVLAARQKKQRDEVRARLKEVEELLASLTAEQLAELARLELEGTDRAQDELLGTGELAGVRAPSASGGEALDYAVRQIGKPYVWGAEGPGSFDCSGLTSQAWAYAGRSIPRTSQEQWRQLPKVPLRSLRPGDLVIYFPRATHVAIYLGHGLVVQAPRPGARVKVSPIAANPLLGAVRPDPGASALASYTPPQLPEDATAGSDTGYSAAAAPDTSAR